MNDAGQVVAVSWEKVELSLNLTYDRVDDCSQLDSNTYQFSIYTFTTCWKAVFISIIYKVSTVDCSSAELTLTLKHDYLRGTTMQERSHSK